MKTPTSANPEKSVLKKVKIEAILHSLTLKDKEPNNKTSHNNTIIVTQHKKQDYYEHDFSAQNQSKISSKKILISPNNVLSTSLLDNSWNFSIKKENHAHVTNTLNNPNLVNTINTNNSPNATHDDIEPHSTNKVIVYNVSDEFLIQMLVIPQNTDPNFVKLQYQYKDEEISVSKNDIFYQPIDSFDTYGNWSEMKIINELSVLKNIQMRLWNKKQFCYIDDIWVLLNFNEDYSTERPFFIEEFIKNSFNKTELLLFRECVEEDNAKVKHGFKFFANYLHIKKEKEFIKYIGLFEKWFSLFNYGDHYWNNDIQKYENEIEYAHTSKRMRYLLHISFESVILNRHAQAQGRPRKKVKMLNFNYLPILSANVITNELYTHNIIFGDNQFEKSFQIETPPETVILNPDINIQLSNLYWKGHDTNTASNANIKSYISTYLLPSFTSNPTNITLLNLLYDIFAMSNMKKYFLNAVKLLLISYVTYFNKKCFLNSSSNIWSYLGITSLFTPNEQNCAFYSNVVILLLFKYINNVLSVQLRSNDYNINDKKNTIITTDNIGIMMNLSNKEDDVLLGEVIKQRVEYSFTKNDSYSTCLSKYIAWYLNENMRNFKKWISENDLNLIKVIEEQMFDLSFLKDLFNECTILDAFSTCYSLSLTSFAKHETEFKKITQVWNFAIGYPYEVFFSTQEKLVEFLQITHIIEYSRMYHYKKITNNFFRNYTNKYFYHKFLPILNEITYVDRTKDTEINYNKIIVDLIRDINAYQGIVHDFEANESNIKIPFATFEILFLLLKKIYDDKCVCIQKIFRGHEIFKWIARWRRNSVLWQRWYKRNIYSNLQKKNKYDLESISIDVLKRFKGGDPLLSCFVFNLVRKYKELVKENNTLTECLEEAKVKTNNANFDAINKESHIKKHWNPSQMFKRFNVPNNNNVPNIKDDEAEKAKALSKNMKSNEGDTSDEAAIWTNKLSQTRTKFKNWVLVIAEYEKKMENFVQMINSNQEIKAVLHKNGITII